MRLLLDTHIWIWFLVGSTELPASLRRLIDRSAERCHLSAISTWELAMLAQCGRVTIDRDVEAWILASREQLPVIEEPVTSRVAMAATRLDVDTRDPADRFIAATAAVEGLVLVTLDDRLATVPGVEVRSR